MPLTALNSPLKNPVTALHVTTIAFQALLAKPPKALNTVETTELTALNIPLKNPVTALQTP